MKKIRILSALMAALLIMSTAACSKEKAKTAYPDKEVGFQLEKPIKGEEIAVMHTGMGDIKIRFFPDGAPKAVENFKKHSKNGYYNGLTFHRVKNDFMIQGGDPKGDGTGGKSVWGKPFKDEFDSKLLNIRGSLAMANSGKDKNGSQFFINQKKTFEGKERFEQNAASYHNGYNQQRMYLLQEYSKSKEYYDSQYGSFEAFFEAQYYLAPDPKLVPDNVWELYDKQGGNIPLDGAWRGTGGHTVFGQVFEGMEVVDSIAAVEVVSDKPVKDIKINSIDIIKY
ncbi:MAG: peptidylprolyl isomerase [Oscillospiraceae bacterium]|nr:peptidylprolyl isomerase [Oscillospiraceae bacterium]MDD4413959.1 peptidylprolyl isomerase [Oscillospiraceae bacterium]